MLWVVWRWWGFFCWHVNWYMISLFDYFIYDSEWFWIHLLSFHLNDVGSILCLGCHFWVSILDVVTSGVDENVPNVPMLQCPMHSGNQSFCDIPRSKVKEKIKCIRIVQWKTSQQIWNVHLIQFPLRQTYWSVIFGDMSTACRIDPFAA